MRIIRALDPLVCHPDQTLRTVIERMTALGIPSTFQIVVDADQRPVGTVTDGDIRRALLRGTTLDNTVAHSMNPSPATGAIDRADGETDHRLLTHEVPFLPLVDSAGILRGVLIDRADPETAPAALIMAGGKGLRLGERTRTTPKPLLLVHGQPILGHIIDRLESAGVESIFLAVHYLSDQIEAFAAARTGKAKTTIIHEPAPLGTAGAIGQLGPTAGPVLILNGDVLTKVDFSALIAFHTRHGHDATVAVARHETTVPFGVVRYDEDGLLLDIDEKPTIAHFIAAGIYCLSPEICRLVVPGQHTNMPDLLNNARRGGHRIGLFPIHEYWVDIGRPDDLNAAQRDVSPNRRQA